MDQDAEYENFEEDPSIEDIPSDQITVVPPLESALQSTCGNTGCSIVFLSHWL